MLQHLQVTTNRHLHREFSLLEDFLASATRKIGNVKRPNVQMRPRTSRDATYSSFTLYTSLISTFLVLCKQVNAQLGTTVCICSPAMYMMSFNFSQTCENTSVTGPGILTTDCAIAPFQNDNITDLTPVSVGSIDILELDADLALFTQSSRFGSFVDGATFSYTSVSSDPTMVNVTQFPKALQVSVIGNNAAGETLFFAGLVIFSTECGIYPVLDRGSTIGWVKFVELTDALNAVCPLAPPPNVSPPPVTSPVIGTFPPLVTSPPSQSSKEPRPTRSPKGITPMRSPKEPTPIRSTKAPSPALPTLAPLMKVDAETIPPSCLVANSSGKGKNSKQKGKSKKDDKNDKGKGDGKGKEKGNVRGSSDSRKKKDKKEYHNIFYHDECPSSKSPAPSAGGKGKGKGKGKGGDYDEAFDFVVHPVPTPMVSLPPVTVKPVLVPTVTADSNDEPIFTQSPSTLSDSALPMTPAPFVGTSTNTTNITSIAIPGAAVDSQEGVTPTGRSASSSDTTNALLYSMLGVAVAVAGASAAYVRRQRQHHGSNLTEKTKLTAGSN